MRLFILFLFVINLFGQDIVTLFKNGQYLQICNKRWDYIEKYRYKDEKKLSLVAYSCLKNYKLIFALDLAKNMTVTKMGRNNALYITSLFLTKKLIISYLRGDNINLSAVNIPYLKDSLIGKIFRYIKLHKPAVKDYSVTFTMDGLKYKVYPFDHSTNLIIEIYKNGKLTKKVTVW